MIIYKLKLEKRGEPHLFHDFLALHPNMGYFSFRFIYFTGKVARIFLNCFLNMF